jgi:hypothetical protein
MKKSNMSEVQKRLLKVDGMILQYVGASCGLCKKILLLLDLRKELITRLPPL